MSPTQQLKGRNPTNHVAGFPFIRYLYASFVYRSSFIKSCHFMINAPCESKCFINILKVFYFSKIINGYKISAVDFY